MGGEREALAADLGFARSVQCEPDQRISNEGVHQAIDLVTRMLGNPNAEAWVEDPGYWGARSVLTANSINAVPIPVDKHGLSLPSTVALNAPKFTFVTQSTKYQSVMDMALARRSIPIRWALQYGS